MAEGCRIDARVCRLGAYEEAVGVLHDVQETEGYILASIGSVVVTLPAILGAKLQPHIEERIGLLRIEKDFRLKAQPSEGCKLCRPLLDCSYECCISSRPFVIFSITTFLYTLIVVLETRAEVDHLVFSLLHH